MIKNIFAYVKLMRPANLPTAQADILYGFAASAMGAGFLYGEEIPYKILHTESLYWLLLSSTGLYAGGLVLNDFFDRDLDKIERPERPLPRGEASPAGALMLSLFLFCVGIISAFKVSLLSCLTACLISVFALYYNMSAKHHPVSGPVFMGICRSANLMLGMSFIPIAIINFWFLLLIPFTYIMVITLLSRGEVNGLNKKIVESAIRILLLILIGIANLAFLSRFNLLYSLPFIILFLAMLVPNLLQVLKNNDPLIIRQAVKIGILALIVLDASLAAGFAGIEFGIVILLLLPLSYILSKGFSVT